MSSIASDAVSPITDYFSYSGQKNAIDAEKQSLNRLKYADPNALEDLASQFDTTRYQKGFSTQQQYDPTYAGLRTQGSQSILDQLAASEDPNNIANTSLKQAQSAASADNAQMAPQIQSLVDRAGQELSSGSTMTPSEENEFVTAGLAKSGQSGINLDGSAMAGSNVRTLLGVEGEQLQAQRAAEAQGLLGTASNLQAQRTNILGNLVTLDQNLRASNAALGTNAASLGLSTVPSIGLSGADAANLSLGNTNLKNQVILGKGKLNAASALNKSNFINSEINSGARIVGDAASIAFGGGLGSLGGMGGGMGSMMGGSGGSGFGFLNGFMNNSGVGYTGSSSPSPNDWSNIGNYTTGWAGQSIGRPGTTFSTN